jgi:hypothetical protein
MNLVFSISFIFKFAGGIYVNINPPNTFSPSIEDSGMSRSLSGRISSSGNWLSCYSAKVTVATTDYIVKLDTGSSDFAIPGCKNLVGYSGPSVSSRNCSNYFLANDLVIAKYADNSSWTGYGRTLNVQLKGTNITALAPTFLIKDQSSRPFFIQDEENGGILGLAFKNLASYQPAWSRFPKTVFDAWVQHMKIPNRISFHVRFTYMFTLIFSSLGMSYFSQK